MGIDYLNPKNDLIFKKLFGEPKDILKVFYNQAIQQRKKFGIWGLEMRNENDSLTRNWKRGIRDGR